MSPLRKALSMAGEGICPDSEEGKPNYTWLYSKVFLTKLFEAKIKPGAELAFRRGLKYGTSAEIIPELKLGRPMYWLLTKYLITAGIVVFISEVAKRSDKLGSLIAALPTVTILALVWMYVEKQPAKKLANHALYTFWYVVPSLPMFLAFPYLYARYSFWLSLLVCLILSAVCFSAVVGLAKFFGLDLL